MRDRPEIRGPSKAVSIRDCRVLRLDRLQGSNLVARDLEADRKWGQTRLDSWSGRHVGVCWGATRPCFRCGSTEHMIRDCPMTVTNPAHQIGRPAPYVQRGRGRGRSEGSGTRSERPVFETVERPEARAVNT
ncbi:hypothetical protein JCGZ_01984 [Jatropha curcas]|uniref:CCHC-type domain-containing protein n=1 Tax=Jatropha curcas TaxID=180498 RepID=A0A067JRZ3_JATCU|nr:hypothetical protein JCGZ_01984 [Jatropha curcas]